MTIRTNYVTNPSFELDVAGWIGAGGATITRSSSAAQAGGWSGFVTLPASAAPGTTTSRFTASGLQVGKTYRCGGWVYGTAASLAALPRIFVTDRANSPNAAMLPFTWQLLQCSFIANATTATFGLVNSAAIATAGLSWYSDSFLLTDDDGPVDGTWDGSSPRSSSYVHWWHGTPGASLSYRSDKTVLTRNGAVAVELDVLDWSDEWAYSGAVLPILGSPRAVDIPASTLHHYGPRKIMATCYMPDEATSWSQLATLLDASAGRTVLRSPDPGLNADAVRIVRARRRPGPIPRRHWPVDLELVEVAA